MITCELVAFHMHHGCGKEKKFNKSLYEMEKGKKKNVNEK